MTDQERELAVELMAAGAKKTCEVAGAVPEELKEAEVNIENVVNVERGHLKRYSVSLAYGDVVLIIGMLMDYVQILDQVRGDDVIYGAYYRKKFLKIAERLEEQIGYSWEEALKKCSKLAKKSRESESDVGEEAMALMLKYSKKESKKKEEKSGTAVRPDDTERMDGPQGPARAGTEGSGGELREDRLPAPED